jgi:peptidylprolyl isomerase
MADIAEKGKKVQVHYTGKLEDGQVFDSSEGKDPLAFEVGAGQVVPGFDKSVEGMKVGDKKDFTLEVADAYGEARDELVQEVPKEALGEMADKVEEGMMLGVHHPQAPQPIPAKVIKIADDKVTLDMNHPLAGKKLNFAVELVGVDEADSDAAQE